MEKDKSAAKSSGNLLRNLYLLTGAITLVYTLLIACSFIWILHHEHQEQLGLARAEALSIFNKDLSFRTWATGHGGVYVPVTAETPPNPYLKVPERDIVTPSGRPLTLMNPAYMMRQAMLQYSEQHGVIGHLTSLNALNPVNAPDPWERQAMDRFVQGEKEVVTVTELDGKPFLRLMKPVITAKGCLKCHAAQGYKEEDIRGGLAVSVPLAPYLAIEKDAKQDQAVSHLLIWLLGVTGIGFGFFKGKASISWLQKAEDKLIKSETSLRTLVQTIPDLIWLKDESGRYLACNTMFERFFGVKEAAIIGKTDYDFVDRELADYFRELDLMAMAAGKPSSNEEWITFADDGHRALLATTKTPMCDADGNLIGVLGIGHDNTERRSLENQLRQSQKLEAIGTLSGGIAHDFNNILSVIIGFGSILDMKMAKDDPLHDNVKQILTAADRAANLTRSMLAFSRKQVIEVKPANMNEIIAGMEKMLRRLIREDIELRICLAEEILPVLADVGQLEQVLLNLTTNAKDSMPNGGTITITTGQAELDDSFRKAHGYGEAGCYVLITVEDSGEGIEEIVWQRIFEPFFTTKEVGKGTGLGLAVCYGIIKQHHGYIVCHSEPGRGTIFRVYLPLSRVEAAGEAAAAVESLPPRGGTETILVAEDDAGLRNFTTSILKEYGYTIIEAEDGAEAVAQFADHGEDIQLCLFDMIMPKRNGMSVWKEIKKVRPDIKVLFMSGYQADAAYEGVNLIAKPVSPRELLKRVRELLDGGDSR